MRTSRLPAFSALAGVLACALVACEGDDPVPPGPCFGCVPDPDVASSAGIVIQNKTDHSISFTLRDLSANPLQIDRKLLEGTLSVPIGPATKAVERSFPLSPEGTTFLGAPVQILSGSNITSQTGGAFRIGGGPFFFAVGRGLLAVRTRDGVDVLEPSDPRGLTVLPVEPDVATCTDEALGAQLPETPSRILSGDAMTVSSVTVDSNGCRVFDVGSGTSAVDYVVCLPEAAYPFDASDTLTMSALGSDFGVRIEGASGVVLELLYYRFLSRQSQTALGGAIVWTENPTCARLSPACGDVEVPAKVIFSFNGTSSQTLAVGESLVDPRNAEHSIVVVGARTRPVLVPGCSAKDSSGVSATAEIVFASIQRPSP